MQRTLTTHQGLLRRGSREASLLGYQGKSLFKNTFPIEVEDFIKRLFARAGPLTVLRADLFGFLVLMESSSLSTELIRALAHSASILRSFFFYQGQHL